MPDPDNTVLILGANGRFGSHVSRAFARAGWTVQAQTRPGKPLNDDLTRQPGITHCPIALTNEDALTGISQQCTVIVNALNPPYKAWEAELPSITQSVIKIAKASHATVMVPGNVYNYGANMPAQLTSDTPHNPTNRLGEVREAMEQAYRDAGIQTIILRIGDFLQRESSGNWFDTHLTAKLKVGKFAYPGRPDIPHAWGYLPDTTRAMVELAKIRKKLPVFTDIPFPGTTLSGNELASVIEANLKRPVKLTTVPWWLLKMMAPFSGDMRGVVSMRYLWNTPHQLDAEQFCKLLPDFEATPTEEIIRDIVSRYQSFEARAQLSLT